MHITETPCDEKIKITKCVNFDCDNKDETIPYPLPNVLNFNWALVGAAGSGKTTLLTNLVCKSGSGKYRSPYFKKFDKVFLWSPSLGSMSKNPFECLPDEQVFTSLDIEQIEGVLEEIDNKERNLFIFDDVVNEMGANSDITRLLAKIMMNRRHLGLALITTSQVYNRIPLVLRRTLTQVTMFASKAKREIDNLHEEHVHLERKQFDELLKYCYKNKNDFLHIDTTLPYDSCFFRNFNGLKLSDAVPEATQPREQIEKTAAD